MSTWTDGWNVEKKQSKPRPGDEFGKLFDSPNRDHKNMKTESGPQPFEKTVKKSK